MTWGLGNSFEIRQTKVYIPVMSFSSCVNLVNLFNFPELFLFTCKKGIIISFVPEVLLETLRELMNVNKLINIIKHKF